MSDDGPQRKRKTSPALVANPFIKKRNLEWRISPPPLRDPERRRRAQGGDEETALGDEGSIISGDSSISKADEEEARENKTQLETIPHPPTTSTSEPTSTLSTSARIESNRISITNHLDYFASHLKSHILKPYPLNHPRLPIDSYTKLYTQSQGNPNGAHFVLTQHDHPIAGLHYDLRLQINATSSCSFAIMYGLPGDPNARGRQDGRAGGGVLRNATETRVHCLWNHLVETAGAETGSLLIWDMGEYEVLPPPQPLSRRTGQQQQSSDSEDEEEEEEDRGEGEESMTQQQKLARAFAARKIRLRLKGTRLPRGYTVYLRLTRVEDAAGRAKAAAGPKGRRKRRRQAGKKTTANTGPDTSDSDDTEMVQRAEEEEEYNDVSRGQQNTEGVSEMERELRELEDEHVRRTNAYPGAENTIGSVHQRKWFLSLDREACGFVRSRRDGRVWWDKKHIGEEQEEEDDSIRLQWPFYVLGPDHERSVVTGRLGEDVLRNEGVEGFVRRKGWKPVLG